MAKIPYGCTAVIAIVLSASLGLGEIPKTFDVRDQWYGCGMATLNQGQCGSCWAVGATGVFGERMCVFLDEAGNPLPNNAPISNRMFQKAGSCTGEGTSRAAHNHGCQRTAQFLSPQMLMSCGNVIQNSTLYPDSGGCQGGEARDAWEFFYTHGLSSMTLDGTAGCTPYTSGKCAGKDPRQDGCKMCAGVMEECEDTGLPPKLHFVDSFGYIMEKGLKPRNATGVPRPDSDKDLLDVQVKNMQLEMMANGPVNVCMDFFPNFQKFFNDQPLGIYNNTEGLAKSGGHCLSVIGWGRDENVGMDYWIIKNSWGENWGSNGVFRFLRGVDFCGIESDVWVGCPANSTCRLTNGVKVVKSRHALQDTGVESFIVNPSTLDSMPADEPSKTWKGGYWHEIPVHTLTPTFTSALLEAFFLSYNEHPSSVDVATAAVVTSWGQVVGGGQRLRFLFENDKEQVVLH